MKNSNQPENSPVIITDSNDQIILHDDHLRKIAQEFRNKGSLITNGEAPENSRGGKEIFTINFPERVPAPRTLDEAKNIQHKRIITTNKCFLHHPKTHTIHYVSLVTYFFLVPEGKNNN